MRAVMPGDADLLLLPLSFPRGFQQAEHRLRDVGIADKHALHRPHVLRAGRPRDREIGGVGIDHVAVRIGDREPVMGMVGDAAHDGVIGGAVAGKKSAQKVEVGFSEEKLRKLNESLAPGGSALFLIVEHRWFNTLQVELAASGGQLIHERLSDVSYEDLVKKMEAGEQGS